MKKTKEFWDKVCKKEYDYRLRRDGKCPYCYEESLLHHHYCQSCGQQYSCMNCDKIFTKGVT